MKKIEFSLPTSAKWGSIVSKYGPETAFVTADSFTSGSGDFITHLTGNIQKRWTDVQNNSTALTGPATDQFEMVFQAGVRHLLFRDNDTLKMTTGDTIIQDIYKTLNTGGSLEYFSYQNVCYLDNAIDNPIAYDLTGTYGGVDYLPVTITISDYTLLAGQTVTIDTHVLTEGVDWTAGTDNNTTFH